ncbi:MAG: plasmid mobilization protein [Saccharofermentanales bacterium]|jgi:predicted transcriptional regulator
MKETINNKKVTEEQIAAWVDEAEKGYDVNSLKKRGRGRPGRGSEPSQVIAVRLTPEELKQLDRKAAEQNMTRSEFIRKSLTA